jgi:replication factor C large subunit
MVKFLVVDIPWTIEHKPKNLSEIVGNKKVIDSLKRWILSWERTGPNNKAALLYGPPGTGKTVSVEALARELDFDLIEMNASDIRTGQAIESIVGSAVTEQSLFNRKKIILLDEVDGISSQKDRGAVQAITKIIDKTNYPILMTTNDAWDPKIRGLREKSLILNYKKIGIRDGVPYLRQLLTKKGIEADDSMLKIIIDRNEGDMRSIINDLQMLTTGKTELTFERINQLAWRNRKEPIFDALKLVFTSKDCLNARKAIEVTDVDYEMLFEWIYENLPRQLSDPYDLSNAMEALAKAELFLSRAKKTQAWQLLSYAMDLMTAGVAMSRKRTKPAWIPMKFPQRITFMSRTMRERAKLRQLGNKIGKKCHVSSQDSIKIFIPYLKIIFKHNEEMASYEMTTYLKS